MILQRACPEVAGFDFSEVRQKDRRVAKFGNIREYYHETTFPQTRLLYFGKNFQIAGLQISRHYREF